MSGYDVETHAIPTDFCAFMQSLSIFPLASNLQLEQEDLYALSEHPAKAKPAKNKITTAAFKKIVFSMEWIKSEKIKRN